MRCPFCGSNLEKDAKYCNDCGTAVDSECKGKNINYRSYTVGRPEQTVKNQPSFRYRQEQKPAVNNQRPQVNMPPQRPAVNPIPPQQGIPFNPRVNTAKKKNGCGIAILIVIIIFAVSSVIGAILGEESGVTDEIKNVADIIQGEEETTLADRLRGMSDDTYYTNNWVNFSFRIPEGYEKSDYPFPNEDILLQDGENEISVFIERENDIEEFIESETDVLEGELAYYDFYDGSNTNVSELITKVVGDNTFYGKTLYCGDIDGQCAIYDFYVTEKDGYLFEIVIRTDSPEINSQVVNSFNLAYTID